MHVIELVTPIAAPPARCFDLSRSVDLHMISTASTQEKGIAGVTKGLMQLHDSVTWQARHLSIRQRLTSRITAFDPPHYFCDEMVRGAFKSFRHEHYFEQTATGTVMRDVFYFESPLGLLGTLANKLFLTRYMKRLLTERNRVVKEFAESDKWQQVLHP